MRAYYAVCRLKLIGGLQYRAAALAGLATQFFWGFMYIMVYEAFYNGAAQEQPIALNELISYLWLQQSFLAFVALWFRDQELFNLITNGNIAYELCRPSGLYGLWYARLLAQRLASALLRCFPILIAALLLPEPYRLSLPPDAASLLLFMVSLLIGLLLNMAISMFIYISVFVTMNPTGSILMIGVFGEFFSGLIIPVPLMPEWLQHIVVMLPFRYTADFPFRVYSGHIPASEAIAGIGIQLLWLLGLGLTGKLVLDKVLKRVVVQGG